MTVDNDAVMAKGGFDTFSCAFSAALSGLVRGWRLGTGWPSGG